jgi:hypothetical protein
MRNTDRIEILFIRPITSKVIRAPRNTDNGPFKKVKMTRVRVKFTYLFAAKTCLFFGTHA